MGYDPTLSEQREFLSRVIAALQRAGIPYMVTGSVSSTLFGEPRATRDVDILIAPNQVQLRTLIRGLSTDYYVSEEAALEAFRERSMFNVIDASTSWKADLIILKATPYDKEKFQRRLQNEYLGIPIEVATPEDVILSKLSWGKVSGSEMQYRDALGVAAVQGDHLDRTYMRRWAKELGVEEVLERILAEADKVG